jgi:retron-type reverse transcriptase
MSEAKPEDIAQREVWEASTKVSANHGAAGGDEQSMAECDKRAHDTLDKSWHRLASGRYVPPPVRTVKMPKAPGGERPLGIPTVSDRLAQMVVKLRLEPAVDPRFHPDA